MRRGFSTSCCRFAPPPFRAPFGWLSPFGRLQIIKLANEKIDEMRRGLQRTLELTG